MEMKLRYKIGLCALGTCKHKDKQVPARGRKNTQKVKDRLVSLH